MSKSLKKFFKTVERINMGYTETQAHCEIRQSGGSYYFDYKKRKEKEKTG